MAEEITPLEMGTSLRIRAKSMTLNKNDIGALCKIVAKAMDDSKFSDMRLIVSGGRESVSTDNVDKLISARWPQKVNEVYLEAFGEGTYIRVTLESRPLGANQITISSSDSDWVTARVKEIEDFIAEHKNWYWIFHNIATISAQVIALAVLIAVSANITFDLSFEYSVMVGVCAFGIIMFIYQGLIQIFPFILVESARSSAEATIRKILTIFIPAVVIGIIIQLGWNLIANLISA